MDIKFQQDPQMYFNLYQSKFAIVIRSLLNSSDLYNNFKILEIQLQFHEL